MKISGVGRKTAHGVNGNIIEWTYSRGGFYAVQTPGAIHGAYNMSLN